MPSEARANAEINRWRVLVGNRHHAQGSSLDTKTLADMALVEALTALENGRQLTCEPRLHQLPRGAPQAFWDNGICDVRLSESIRRYLPPRARRRPRGPRPRSRENIAVWRIGRYAVAEAAYREALAIAKRHHGDHCLSHKVTVYLTANPKIRAELLPGQMLDIAAGTDRKMPRTKTVHLGKLLATSKLGKAGGFRPLPSQAFQ
jgi:hypothetical protein